MRGFGGAEEIGKPGGQCPGKARQEQGQSQGRNGRDEEVTRLRILQQ